MDFGISDKTALVLGGSGGLGGAMARALANEGVAVAVAGRNADALNQTAEAIKAAGGRACAVAWDLGDLDAAGDALATVERTLGPVDILVNNPGGPPPTPVAGQDPEAWATHFRAMVQSVISLTDRVLPGMRTRGWGRIITSTSSGVVAPIPNLGLSNSLRATMLGWSKTLAREVAGDGVTCNILVPGRIATARTRQLDEKRAEREGKTVAEVEAASCATIPMGRYGDVEEYGAVCAFLASRQAGYVTGSVVRVDGGFIPSI